MATVNSVQEQIKDLLHSLKEQQKKTINDEIQSQLFDVYLKNFEQSYEFLINTVKNSEESDFLRNKCLNQFNQAYLITENQNILDKFQQQAEQTYTQLESIIYTEPKRNFRTKIAELLLLLKDQYQNQNLYDEVMSILKNETDLIKQDAALLLLANILAYEYEEYENQTQDFLQVTLKFLQSEELMLQTSAFTIIQSIYQYVPQSIQKKINQKGNILTKILKTTIENEEEQLGLEVLNCFQTLTEEELIFLKSNFDMYFDQIIAHVQNTDLKKNTRIQSIRILVIYLECYGKFPVVRGKQYAKVFLQAYFTLLLPDYDEPSEDFIEAIVDITVLKEYVPTKLLEYLDIIFQNTKGSVLMPFYEELFTLYIVKNDWKSKYAAVVSISQIGEHVEDKTFILNQIPILLETLKSDNVPLKFAACHSLGQLGDDMKEEILSKYANQVMDSFVELMENDPNTVIQAHAISAVANVIEQAQDIENFEQQFPKIDKLVIKTVDIFKDSQSNYFKENGVQFLSCAIECLEKDFSKHKELVLPILKVQFQDNPGKSFAQLRGQCLECLSFMYIHLQEDFSDQVEDYINLIINTDQDQLEEYDNPILHYVIKSFRTIFVETEFHKEKIQQLLPQIIQFFKKLQQILLQNSVLAKEEFLEELSKKDDGKNDEDEDDEAQDAALIAAAGITQSANKDNQNESNEPKNYDSFSDDYKYFIETIALGQETFQEFNEICTYFYQNGFVDFIKIGFLTEEFDDITEAIKEQAENIIQGTFKYLGQETYNKQSIQYLQLISHSIKQSLQENREDLTKYFTRLIEVMLQFEKSQINKEGMDYFKILILELFQHSFDKYKEDNANLAKLRIKFQKQVKNKTEQQMTEEDDILIEEQEQLVEDIDGHIEQLTITSEIITQLYTNQQEVGLQDELKYIKQSVYTNVIQKILKEYPQDQKIQKILIFLTCDAVEFFKQIDQNFKNYFNILKDGLKSDNWEIRQAAGYGMGHLAKKATQCTDNSLNKSEILQSLQQSLQNTENMKFAKQNMVDYAKDNLTHALFKAVVYADHLDYKAKQSIFKIAFNQYLPMVKDKVEILQFYNTFYNYLEKLSEIPNDNDLVQFQILLGEENQNLQRILFILNEGHKKISNHQSTKDKYPQIAAKLLKLLYKLIGNKEQIITELQKSDKMSVEFLEFVDLQCFQ